MSDSRWPQALRERPVCPHRHLPIPFIAEIGPDGRGEFTILDHGQAMKCLEGRLCAMCGAPMDDQVTLIGDVVSLDPDGYFIEPPVHEECGRIAIGGLCPYLSRQRLPRRIHGDDVAVVGSLEDLAGVGRSTAKRPVIMAIATDYQAGHVIAHTGSPVLAYRAQNVVQVVRYEYRDGRLAEIQYSPARPPARIVRVQPRRRPRSKR